jgi:hypothetical protein
MEWFHLPRDKDQWRCFVKTVMNNRNAIRRCFVCELNADYFETRGLRKLQVFRFHLQGQNILCVNMAKCLCYFHFKRHAAC